MSEQEQEQDQTMQVSSQEEAINFARHAMGSGCIFICHGRERCETRQTDVPFEPCHWCYRLAFGDERTTKVILEDIAHIQRGH